MATGFAALRHWRLPLGGSSSTVMPASSYRTVKLLLDILQGMGVSTAAGVRPFLPTLLVGALAADDLGVDFDRTDFAFLESPWFLLAIAVASWSPTVLRSRFETPAGEAALGGIGMGLGALLFAGTLDDHYSTWWPGIIGGLRVRAHRPAGDPLAADPHARAPGRRGGGRALPLRGGAPRS